MSKNVKKRERSNYWKASGSASLAGFKASLALEKANKALDMMNPEFKTIDKDVTIPSVGTAINVQLLNGVQRGDDYNQRVGRSMRVKSIELNMLITKNPASTGYERVRVILLLDKDPDSTTITNTEIFASITSQIISPRNLDNRNRLVMLKDWVYTLNKDGGPQSYNEQYYRKLGFHTIYNNSNLGTIADINENALYLIVVSDTGINTPSFTYYSRLRFLDN